LKKSFIRQQTGKTFFYLIKFIGQEPVSEINVFILLKQIIYIQQKKRIYTLKKTTPVRVSHFELKLFM